MVLEMLAAGKITIEQANQLIEVLGEPSLSTAEQCAGQRQREERGTPHLEPLEPVEPLDHRRRTNFTLDQMIELSEHEVDPSYLRSEERRVGKEGKSRWSEEAEKNKNEKSSKNR